MPQTVQWPEMETAPPDAQSERLQRADALLAEASADLGLDPESVSGLVVIPAAEIGSAYAEFDSASKEIHIRDDHLSTADEENLAHTLAHEARHAYQWKEIERLESGLQHDPRAAEWRQNWHEYKNPDDLVDAYGVTEAYRMYSGQPIEADAFGYAQAFWENRR